MDPLVTLAESSIDRISPRRYLMRGAVAGAVLYAGFAGILALSAIGTTSFSVARLLWGLGFGLIAGGLMGTAYAGVLGRFSRQGFLAHVVAGLAGATVLFVPAAIIARALIPLLPVNPIIAAGAVVLALGTSLGAFVWSYTRYGDRAA